MDNKSNHRSRGGYYQKKPHYQMKLEETKQENRKFKMNWKRMKNKYKKTTKQ